jgi:glucose/mannose transport system permease protein
MAIRVQEAEVPVGQRQGRMSRIIIFLVLSLAVLFYALPIYVMVITGFKAAADVSLSDMWAPPTSINLDGYRSAWDRLNPNLLSTFLVVIPATAISGLLGAINGYLFSKWKFRGSDLLFTLLLFGMFIPYQSILIPLIRFLQEINLYGTIPGLILVHVVYGLPITTLIFRNYFTNIPGELVEAARVDGDTVMGIFRRILLPLSIPAFVVVGIFQFTNIWNDFLFGLVVVPNPNRQPIMIALNNLSGGFSVAWNVLMAGAVIAALPTAIIYILLGRFFIRGMLAGSMKG